MYWYGLVKYWLPIAAIILTIHSYILTCPSLHTLISRDALPGFTSGLYLFPINLDVTFWQLLSSIGT